MEKAKMVQRIAADHGGADFARATDLDERRTLWQARHDASYAAKALRPGALICPTDVCVPISRLAECITETQNDLAASFLSAPIVGYVGDGNFHLFILLDPNNPKEVLRLNGLTIDSSIAHCHSRVPAAASMGSVMAKSTF